MSDLRYARCSTRHGEWWFAWSNRGLVASAHGDDAERDFLAQLPGVARQGSSQEVPEGIDWSSMPAGFRVDVLRALMDVPEGEVVSYGELAELAGRPRAARAVGTAMATNPLPLVVPCHRVIRADGLIGEYGAGGPGRKAQMLAREGVHLAEGRIAR